MRIYNNFLLEFNLLFGGSVGEYKFFLAKKIQAEKIHISHKRFHFDDFKKMNPSQQEEILSFLEDLQDKYKIEIENQKAKAKLPIGSREHKNALYNLEILIAEKKRTEDFFINLKQQYDTLYQNRVDNYLSFRPK